MTTNLPALMTTVDDLLDARGAALAEFDIALRALALTQKKLNDAGFGNYAVSSTMDRVGYFGMSDPDRFRRDGVERLRGGVDRALWNHLGEKTGLLSLMDTGTREKWKRDIEQHGPVCTRDALEATFASLHEQRELIFERGLVTAFAKLSSNYRTNDPFKLGPKIIVTGCSDRTSHGREYLVDAERVLYVLDGKRPPAQANEGIAGAMAAATGTGWGVTQQCDFESEYLVGRLFLNGNAHVRFKDDALREKANRIIARHYGETLPDGRQAA